MVERSGKIRKAGFAKTSANRRPWTLRTCLRGLRDRFLERVNRAKRIYAQPIRIQIRTAALRPPLASEKVANERKIFFLDLKENQRGRFLKITEDVAGRRNTIMVPAPAFKDFLEALTRLIEFEQKL